MALQLYRLSNRCFSCYRVSWLLFHKPHRQILKLTSVNYSSLEPKLSSRSSVVDSYDFIVPTSVSASQPQSVQKKVDSANSKDEKRPNRDDLQKIHDVLTESLKHIFTKPMNYKLYHPNIILVDNIRNKRTEGLVQYVSQVAWLRTVGHLKFAYVRLDILNTEIIEEELRINVRWRIAGISGLRVMLKFWKFRLWNWKNVMSQQETWLDGISHYDLGPDGLIHRHVIDKVMEDRDRVVHDSKSKTPAAAKLGVLASTLPDSSLCKSNSLETKKVEKSS